MDIPLFDQADPVPPDVTLTTTSIDFEHPRTNNIEMANDFRIFEPNTNNQDNTLNHATTSYNLLLPYIDKNINNNPRCATSTWGIASTYLYQRNELPDRKFLCGLAACFQKRDRPKYKTITPAIIHDAISTVHTPVSTMWLNFTTEIWRDVSQHIFSTSTKYDILFVSQLWKVYSENIVYSSHPSTQSSIPSQLNIILQSDEVQNSTVASINHSQHAHQREKITNRRNYLSQYYKSNAEQFTLSRPSRAEPPQVQNSNVDLLTEELTTLFHTSIWQFPTTTCATCDKLIYPSKSHSYTVDERVHQNITNLGHDVPVGSRLTVCDRCYNNMRRGTLSPQVKFNNLMLPPVPAEIEILTSAEIRLVSQVKLFMKVYLLSNGRGQPALKGLAIHFPLSISEVVQQLQLPTQLSHSDIVFVAEDFAGIDRVNDFNIRPANVYKALCWLKNNNPLYSNIEIVPNINMDISTVCVQQQQVLQNRSIEVISNETYRCISPNVLILRASVHQGHPMFMPHSGRQCSAMSATFIAFSYIQPPITWTKETLDQVLICGNNYYNKQSPTATSPYLTMDEVEGTVSNVFQSLDVQLEIDYEDLFGFQGYLNKFPGDVPRLQQIIQKFIDTDLQSAIFTSSTYSMALFKDESHLYFFDSHSRGSKGGVAQNGSACLIQYTLPEAPLKLSYLINHNIQPSITAANAQQQDILLSFTITPFRCSYPTIENSSPNYFDALEDDETELTPTSKRPRLTMSSQVSDTEFRPVHEVHLPLSQLIAEGTGNFNEVTDCVIAVDNFVEPSAQEVMNLHRTAGRPLNSNFQDSLDLLAFPSLFPHGVNGIHQSRKLRITPPDYFQQRLMSADRRFAGNTDLLFYALAESDKFRVQQKIGICCIQKNQVGGGNLQDSDLPPGGKDPSSYMSAIRGSAPYWKQYCGDLIAMIKQLGIPTFFLTFSFDDLNSSDAIAALWKAEHGSEAEPPENLSFEQRKQLLNKYPIAAARHFSMRVTKFLSLLQSRSPEIFGRPLVDYSIRIEFQARGSPHAHCLIWLNDAPDFRTPEGITFIDKNVSCSLQTASKELVLKYQNHKHSPTCFKNKKKKTCRFSFPKKLCERTTVIPETDISDNGGKFMNLKREQNETMINNYHPILIHILRCNMDIQPVTGEMAIAFYIAKYMSKPEPANIRAQIQTSIETVMKSNLTARQKMNKVAMTLMKNREISAQEAAFRLCHLYLRKSSRVCIFVPTFVKESRLRMVRKETIGQDAQFCLNVIDRYMARPVSLESICLFEFAAQYQPYTSRQRREDACADDDVDEFREETEEIIGNKTVLTLLDDKGKIFKRSMPAVVKYPNFDINKDIDSYYYSLILLYLPFREEKFCDNDSPIDVFKEKYSFFRNHSDNPIVNHELAQRIDQALLRVTEYSREENNLLDLDATFEGAYVEPVDVSLPLTAEEVFYEAPVNIVEQIKSMFITLSEEQKQVFLEVDEALKSRESEPMKLIVCGEGGTGKSYLIRLLSLLIRNFHQQDSLLIAAPTGKAAFNIHGATLHRTFALPVEIGTVGTYHPLGGRKLEELRRLYENVKFVFIDEFSMVSYETLRNINRRMGEIFSSDEPYADKNVILLGDLMQLKPPRGSWIFKKPEHFRAELDLWRMLKFFELTVNHRQTGLDPLLSICSKLRVGELDSQDIETLQSRLLDPSNPNHSVMKEKFKNCVRVLPTLKQVATFNKLKTQELQISGHTIYKWIAKDTYADGLQYGQEVLPGMVPACESKCGGLPQTLEVGVGSRIMLRQNVYVPTGLVNGAMGTIVGFEWTFGHQLLLDVTLPQTLIIKFDHLAEPQRVEPCTTDFMGKRHKRITRLQLPIIQADAVNVHKMQGDTVDDIVLDLGKGLFAKGMAYVGISRVKTMNGLAISCMDVNKLIRTIFYCPCDTDALAELNRLREMISARNAPQNL